MMPPSFVVMLLLLCIATTSAVAQKKKELEESRRKLLKEIEVNSKRLKTTQKDKEVTLDHFEALQAQVKKRSDLVANIVEEISDLDERITSTNAVVEAMKLDVERLKTDYGVLLRRAYRVKATNHTLLFLFSSKDFNDALRRWQYIRRYEQYRAKQAKLILATQKDLENKIKLQAQRRQTKQELWEKEQDQKELLEVEKQEQAALLAKLKKEESRLKIELADRRSQHEQLNVAIESIIKSEMAARLRQDRTTTNPKLGSTIKNEPVEGNIATLTSAEGRAFLSKRGKLPFPVAGGIITRRFGKQEHPTLKGIQIENNGIDIQTDAAASVWAVAEGVVSGVQFIPGQDYMLIIRHGDYYTVYSKLKDVLVKRGDKVNAKQTIGTLSSTKPEVHFEVWRGKNRLDPARWVSN